MSTYKHFERICLPVLAAILLLTTLFMNAEKLGVQTVSAAIGYENRLFDASSVHTIDIIMDDWDGFLENCTDEEYVSCAVLVDGEAYRNVGLRAKGNTSLTQVAAYGNDRYSFKIEFDHYEDGKTYYGLDKLCLNNVIQDNTYMKEFFSYRIMEEAGAVAPLCSYVNISVNGEPWGLYLAVEGIEESFLTRSYGADYGELYKPDGTQAGGGNPSGGQEKIPAGDPDTNTMDAAPSEMMGGRGGRQTLMGDGDVLLQYTDDEPDSYSNIFNNAKTEVSQADKNRLVEALKILSSGEAPEDAVDIDSVIRYFTAHNFVLNFDSYTGSMIHNYYLYEENGRLAMLPWDYNLAFGGFESAGGAESLVNYPIDTPVSGGTVEERPMLAWIFSDEAYTEQYHQCFSELIQGYFESGRFAAEIDSVADMIRPYVEADPTKFCTFEEFEKGADTLKEFCLLRAESVRGQLDGQIGRTADTQNADTLIDANGLNISDMGSMGGRGMPDGGTMPDADGSPGSDAMPDTDGSPGSSAMPGADAFPGGAPIPGENGVPDGDAASDETALSRDGGPAREALGRPGGFGGPTQESSAGSAATPLLLTVVSIAVLLVGLLFARLFKTRI